MRLSEKSIAATCVQFLELDGWRAIKMEPISRREWGKGTGEIGQADYLFIRYEKQTNPPTLDIGASQVLWCEWKSKTGRHGERQKEWQRAERARGALVWVAKQDFDPTIEAFQAHYRKSGLMRRLK